MSPSNSEFYFTSSFLIWMPFNPFSYIITIAKTSKIILNKIDGSGHPCLVSDLRGNAFSFSPLSMMLAIGFSYMVFILLRYISSMPSLLMLAMKNGCWIFSYPFFLHLLRWFLFFILLIWWITKTGLQTLNHPCIPGVNSTWSCCSSLLMYYWIVC